ncbi:MAG: GNAT family N-acetyltransferase [Pseudomonadota bacterium]
MTDIVPIATLGEAAQEPLRALNNDHARETSFLDRPAWDALIADAFLAVATPGCDALLIVFDQSAAYDSPNFLWFRARFARFVYVDRIVVSKVAQGQGRARALYQHLFMVAAAAGHARVVCEVNSDPPNPGSDAFHARLGFEEVGTARLAERQKSVRYLERLLTSPAGLR